ncbi:MAG: GAF domain-containing protein [Reichenbachiella sp.]|uniref:GAF domain-containing protein n=1 Tax=Reichenbachiella sp. TaxID=2184521 RepID=UPI003298603F
MRWLQMTDYKIQSNKVFFSVLIVSTIVSAILVVIDFYIDFKSAPIEVYAGFFFATLTISLLSIKYNQSNFVRSLLPTLIFLLLEGIFLNQPRTFSTVVYWFPFIPILAVLMQGLRASQIWFGILLVTYLANYFYVDTILGSTYHLELSSKAYFISGIIFHIAILTSTYLLYNLLGNAYILSIEKNTELSELKDTTEQKSLRLTAFNSALIELTRNPEASQTLEKLFENVCTLAQDSLEVNRVCIWLFDENRNSLKLEYLIENGKTINKNLKITREEYPSYFKALETKPYIMAHDAIAHHDTLEFKDNYLTRHEIKSMLDCPILLDKKSIGVVCCEHVKEKRHWEAQDALITQSLADFIANHYKNEQIKSLLNTLKTQNQELSLNSSMIKSMNIELNQLNEKLLESNESLELAVDERTKELLMQNNQLKEYAFVNSHMLRAPLSSILGISNLLQIHNTSIEDAELLNALHKSTKNLDEIIRKISSTLEDGSSLTRNDIDFIINKHFKETGVE